MSDLPRLLSSFSAIHRAAARRHDLHTEATRARLRRASVAVVEALPAHPPALLARQVLSEHAEAQLPLPAAVQLRLEAAVGDNAHLGRALALLVQVDEERGLCRPVEVALELGAEPVALYTFRAAQDAVLQAGRVAHVAARRHLLPPGRSLLMWDLPGTQAAEIEGPSLGLALLAATWSATHGVVIPEDWAFTGALGSQGGQVVSVGHLPAKLAAAKQAGCRRVFLPQVDHRGVVGLTDLELTPVASDVELVGLLSELLPAREVTDPQVATQPARSPWRAGVVPMVALALGVGWGAGRIWTALSSDPARGPVTDATPPGMAEPTSASSADPAAPVAWLSGLDQHPAGASPDVSGGPPGVPSPPPAPAAPPLVVLLDPRAVDASLPCIDGLMWSPDPARRLPPRDAALLCTLRRLADDRARLVAIDIELVSGTPKAWLQELDATLNLLRERSVLVYPAASESDPLLDRCAADDTHLCADGFVSTDVGPTRDPVTHARGCVGTTPTLAWVVALALHEPAGWRQRLDACVRTAHPLALLPTDRPWQTRTVSEVLHDKAGSLDDRVVIVGHGVSGPDTSHRDVFSVRSSAEPVRLAGAELHAWLALNLPFEE